MKPYDLVDLALTSLWRTKLRTTLTTLGVIIGIGALVSMVSFGTGMQKNITQTFHENDLFTSLHVTPQKVDLDQIMEGDVEGVVESFKEETPALDDSALQKIQSFPEVEIAFPEIRFPVKIRLGDQETRTTLQALPADMGRYKPFSQIPHGRFFATDTASSVVLSPRVLKNLKFVLRDPEQPSNISLEDSLRGMQSCSPDSLLGRTLQIVTSVVDVKALSKNPFDYMRPSIKTPFRETVTPLTIVGIQKAPSGFENGRFAAGAIVPIKTAETIPRLGFSSVWEILGKADKPEGYDALYVRVKNIQDVETVGQKIENMGFGVFSIADELEEIRKGFIILDTTLGAIGTIALIVAALGIINTMVMSILERTREIGIMKAIGGSENEIKGIFFFEAGTIGLLGGIFGLILGWLITRIANLVANYYIAKEGGPHVDFFYIPPWLILGALAFSVLVSLLAGLYPAVRAARVDPVRALRHD